MSNFRPWFYKWITYLAAKGINDISGFLNEILQTTPIKVGTNAKGPFAEYLINGNKYRVAYGTNGYIVSFYPIDN